MAISVCKLPATLQFHSLAGKPETRLGAARVQNLSFGLTKSAVAGVSYGRRVLSICAASTPAAASPKTAAEELDDRVVEIHSIEEFDNAIKEAKRKLVVVEFAASHSRNSKKIYPAMVELSRTSQNAVFLLVMGDESEQTKEICVRAGIEKVLSVLLTFQSTELPYLSIDGTIIQFHLPEAGYISIHDIYCSLSVGIWISSSYSS